MSTRIVTVTLTSSTNGYSAQGTAVKASAIQPGTAGALFDGNTAYGTGGPYYSVPVWVGDKDTLSLQFSCSATGSPLGSLIMQGSNDPGNASQGGNLSNLPDVTLLNWGTVSFWDETLYQFATARAVSGAQSYILTIPILSVKWWRMQWTNTSGTINIIARLTAKGDGGR